MDDILTKDVRGKRLREIQLLQLDLQKESRQEMVGRTYRVLIEGQSTMKGQTKWVGRTNCFRLVHFVSDRTDLKWKWADIKITSTTALSCQGEIVNIL
jgi:tRNA-2-methylthio-N6-dimethylallyladenosine synthase